MKETWFLLFDGSSPDGRGSAEFKMRTLDKEIALRHWKRCKDNPYSTGYVLIITDRECLRPLREVEWNKY